VKVGRRLLATKRHDQVSLREVARRTGFAPSSIYEHFDNRQDLLEAIAKVALLDLGERLVVGCNTGSGLVEHLLNAAGAYVEFATTRPNEFDLVFSRPRPPDQLHPPAGSPLLPIVAEIMRAVREGECAVPAGLTPLDMALSVWAQTHGIAVLRSTYLADTAGFEAKARQLIAAAVGAWIRTP